MQKLGSYLREPPSYKNEVNIPKRVSFHFGGSSTVSLFFYFPQTFDLVVYSHLNVGF